MKPQLNYLLKPRTTYAELAREYGCTRGFVSNIANGRCKAPARFKVFCAKKLGLPVEVIFPEANREMGDK